MHVHLERRRVPDDEQRVAKRLQLPLERGAVETSPLHQEGRAVAELRELAMDRLQSELVRRSRHRRDELLAGDCRDQPAHDLDEAGAARVDDVGVPEDVEQLGGTRERGLSPGQHGL